MAEQETCGVETVRKAVTLFLGRMPETNADYAAVGKRLATYKRRDPYDSYYIKSICDGKYDKVSQPILEAAESLIAELQFRMPEVTMRQVVVLVPEGIEVAPNSVILRPSVTCICGVSFLPTIWNQLYHTIVCAVLARKVKR